MDKTHAPQTIRLPAYAELLIDSMDRYRNGFPSEAVNITTSSRWTTSLNNYALNGYFTRLAVTQIQFQWNLPTIIGAYNNIFTIVIDNGEDEGEYEIELQEAFYTPTELASEIEDKLQTACPNSDLTCVYESASGVFYIASGDGTEFTIQSPDEAGDPTVVRRTLHTLGFTRTNALPRSDYFGTIPTMLPTRYIDIISAYISKFQDVKDSSTSQNFNWQNKIARVYAVPPSNRVEIKADGGPSVNPYIMTIDYATPKQIMWSPDEALNNFTVELRDEEGEYLPFGPIAGLDDPDRVAYGCEYSMTLLASET